MNQTERTSHGPLLLEDGTLKSPGWSREPIWSYNRAAIAKGRLSQKEWDYVLVMNHACATAFTMADLGYARMLSATFIRMDTGKQVTRTLMLPGKKSPWLSDNSSRGQLIFQNKEIQVIWKQDGPQRHLYVKWNHFYRKSPLVINLSLEETSPESMNMATPFKEKGCFYLNRKHNCLKASGSVAFHYKLFPFSADHDLACLDWGRGVWPYKSEWYWGTGSGYVNGVPFGFNMGFGFGQPAATENAIFHDGKVHKLGEIKWEIPEKEGDFWVISESNGRLQGIFTPEILRSSHTRALVIDSNQNQHFGTFTGKAVLDDGTEIQLDSFPCALEHVQNRY